jgi:hypothetical protein
VKKRADQLLAESEIPQRDRFRADRREPTADQPGPGPQPSDGDLTRRASDAPLRINVLADGYWDLLDICADPSRQRAFGAPPSRRLRRREQLSLMRML